MSDDKTTVPNSPWMPHGPVHYGTPFEKWGDRERAAYVMSDIQTNGIEGIDADQWVADFLVKLLWSEIQRGAEANG